MTDTFTITASDAETAEAYVADIAMYEVEDEWTDIDLIDDDDIFADYNADD